MRSRPFFVSAAVAVALVVVLGSCSRTFSAREDDAAGTDTAIAQEDAATGETTTTTSPDEDSIPTVPVKGPIQTLPEGDPKPVPSKAPQTVPPADGFGGDPPSFPDFTFTASAGAEGVVQVTGSGCAGGKVNLYPSSSDSEEGGDPVFASPNSSGNWSATVHMTAGKLRGTCVAIGSGGQTHVGGSHTVTIS